MFGRGGEEVEACEAGLPVAIVPGVTAALGCAASAGIPLTHRKLASAVTFVSGHSAEGSREARVAAGGRRPCAIACWLRGAQPNTPVAIIENGTRPDERVSTGRLSDLTRLAAAHARGDAGPSLIIVGEVAALARAEQQPLAKVS